MGIDLRDVDQPIGTLSGGERQCVAIARAVYFGAKVLILDEPTAALGVKQSGVVLKYIIQARERGLGVIFITHNPHHAYPVGDRFLLLNRGRSIGYYTKEQITLDELTGLMAGGSELEQLSHELEGVGGAAAEAGARDGGRRERARHLPPAPQPRWWRLMQRLRAGHLPRLLGRVVRRRPAPDPVGAVPRRGRRGGLRVAGAGPVRLPADGPGPAGRRAGPARAEGGRRHHARAQRPAPGRGLAGHRPRHPPGGRADRRRRRRGTWCSSRCPATATTRPGAYLEAAELDAGAWRTLDRGPRTSSARWCRRSTACGCSSTRTPTATWRRRSRPSGSWTRPTPATSRSAWTPGTWRTGTRTTSAIIRGYPERIGYVHIKQMDPAVVEVADREGLAFGQAVGLGASCEPPRGEPDIEAVDQGAARARHRPVRGRRAGHVPGRLRPAEADRAAHLRLPARPGHRRAGRNRR